MCYKYVSGIIFFIDIFVICKYFKIIFMFVLCKIIKIEIKGVLKFKIVYKFVWLNKEICIWYLIVFIYICICI